MHPDLQMLLELQASDLARLETDVRLQALAEEIGQLDQAVAGARAGLAAAESRLAELQAKRDEQEAAIETHRVQQEKRRQRIEQVRTAREVQALMTEMDLARSVLARQESEWMKLAESAQQAEGDLKEAGERVAALEGEQTGERIRLMEILAGLEAERAERLAEREACAAAVERTLRVRYDRLRSARTNAVVVPLRGDACGACFTAVPRNRRTQIRAGLLLDGCEACGVILYAVNGEE